MKKILLLVAVLLTTLAHAQLKFTYVNPATDQIKIKNYGAMAVDISTYRLCAEFEYATLNTANVSIVSGDFNLAQNEEVTIAWANPGSGFGTTASDLGLYLPSGSFGLPSSMVDFMQYGAGGQGRESVANSAGLWTSGTFLTGSGPWFYIGGGLASGVTEWIAQPVNVTFQVDLSPQTISANDVHLAGSFQNWNPGTLAMTAVGNGIYSVTMALQQGTYQYKYINGNSWPEAEMVPASCGVSDGFGGYNRQIVVSGTSAITIPVVCFGQCAACPPPALPINVTLQVDMTNEMVGPNGVHVAGNFQGWNATTSPMVSQGNGLYNYTFEADANSTLEYKFINGNAFANEEMVPAECGTDNGFGGFNRGAILADTDTTLAVVCFSTCAECETVVVPDSVNVTLYVNMQDETLGLNGVHVAGTFNNWSATATEMTDMDADGVFETTLLIAESEQHFYKFINGNTWGNEEIVPAQCALTDGGGNLSRVFYTDTVAVVQDTVCFGSCTNCNVIIVDPSNMITLSVNMQDQTVSPNGVHVAGNFQGWDPAMSEMTDDNADGIYEITFEADEWSNLSYKFINGNTWNDAEVVPAECGLPDGNGGNNRILETGTIDVIASVVCFGECVNCTIIVEPTFVDVTFSVNMANETVDATGVHIAGNMQSWDPAASEMTDVDADGIYTITLPVETNTTAEFRFINGNDWPMSETVPATCGTDDGFGGMNRTIEVADADTAYTVVCFGSCVDCDIIVEPTFVDVTFSVNMANETVDANGVHIAGNMQSWDPATSEMTDVDADGIYTITLPVETNTTAEFRFINGNDWPMSETVPATCGTDDGFGGMNRTIEVADADTAYAVVCFGSCVDCDIIVEPTFVDVTFSVNMANETVDANGVHIAGSMQSWDPAASEMTDVDADGIYTITLPVETNTTAEFRFINGNDWPMSETVPATCGTDDGFGGFNRTIEVADADTAYAVVCFGSCVDCDIIVEPTFVDVTFSVNMANETVDANGVHIAGNMQSWDPTASEMTDVDADGIYTITLPVETNTTAEFRFINGNDWPMSETVPATCGTDDGFGGFNRTIEVADADTAYALVCFGDCVDCDIIVEPTTVTALFQVDMTNETVSANGVHVAGNFQGWNPNGTVMTDLGNGIYEIAYEVETNQTIQFKFINGSDWPFAEVVPAECGMDDGFGGVNRSLEILEENLVFGPICFAACIACEQVVEPATVAVTFKVDMTNETVSANGVHIAGNFQGWNPASSTMTDANSDGIYEYTAQIDTNSTVLFKFINGNDWPFAEVVPAACGLGDGFGGYNRNFDVAVTDATYGPVCFAACEACAKPTPVLITFRVDMTNETVATEGVFIAGDFNAWSGTNTEMSEYAPGLYQAVVVINSGETVQYKFLNGINYETVPTECGTGAFSNRSYTAGVANETLAPVCFSGCAACTSNPMVDITFLVDLGQLTADAAGVHFTGSFNAFSPTATPMTLAFNNVYTATVSVAENALVLYKFINGNTFTNVETVPFECGVDDGFGGYNRSITVDNVDVSLPEVCFSSCVDCPIGLDELNNNTLDVYPNPASSTLIIDAKGTFISTLNILDVTGRIVQNINMYSAGTMQTDVSNLSAGMYHITDNNGKALAKLIVE